MRTPNLILLAAVAAAALTGCNLTDPATPGALVPATVVDDRTLPAIEVNGSRFHAQTFGDATKPVIVFLHGGPGGDYRSLLALATSQGGHSLADDHFLVFYDQRGAGLSQRWDGSKLNLATYDADLDAIIDRYSPGRPVFLIGQSWGGMLTTAYIDAHPQRVAGAVLIEPGPLTGARFESRKKDIVDMDLFSEWLNDAAWATQFISADGHARMDYQRLIGLATSQPRSHERKDVDPEPVWRLGAVANLCIQKEGTNAKGIAIYDFTRHLSRYTTPVLFIAGALSEILGESLQREQVHDYPSASLVVIPNAGHDAHWTHTAEVLDAIRNYLAVREGGL